ncbi:MAG: hypothetical protein K0U98_00705 [Deltaproteobacteria bacterium]|nr:hypothetical protein [Deltaproteobacteria bacterium]
MNQESPIPKSELAGRLLWLASMAISLWFSYLNRFFELDDALIYHRYLRNLLRGEGLVYNPGEAFNALTSPAYTYLSLVSSWLLGDVGTASVALAAVLFLALLTVFFFLFRRVSGSLAAGLGCLLAATSPYLYQTFGMESLLFVLLTGICLWLFEAEQGSFWLGIACALLILTRSEGVFLVAALVIRHLWLRRPFPRLRDFLLPALLVFAVLVFNFQYYGEPLPHTAQVKIDQGRSGLWGDWPLFLRAGYHLNWFFAGSKALAAILGLAALGGFWALRRRSLGWNGAIFLGLLLLFYVGLNIPSYHWYYAPFYVAAFFLAPVGFSGLWNLLKKAPHPILSNAARWALAGLCLWVLGQLFADNQNRLSAATAPPPYQQIGLWLKDHAAGDAKLAAAEIGTLGWYSELYMIDILGLVTPENSRFIGERQFGAWLELHSPDYVLIHAPPWATETAVVKAAARGRFLRDSRFSFPGFQLYRTTGQPARETIAEILLRLAAEPVELEEQTLAQRILDDGLYNPIHIAGANLVAVNLTSDRWTRGTQPTAVAARNPTAQPQEIRLRLACVAESQDLPVTAWIRQGETRQEIPFFEAGTQEVNLGTLAPGEIRLFLIHTDKAWTPAGKDRRRLGVKIFPPQ